MSGQQFVEMYHPQLGNTRVSVSLSSVDDHAARGWLLVSGGTPAPSSPYLTPTAADSRYLPKPAGGSDGQALVKSGPGVTWGAAGLTAAQLAAAPEMAAAFDPAGAAAAAVTPTAVAANLPARLADTALKAAFVPKWKPSTAYAQGDPVVNPAGQLVTANAAFTSGTTYSAGNWTVIAGGGLTATQIRPALVRSELWDEFTDVTVGAKPVTAASGQAWKYYEVNGALTVATGGRLGISSGNAGYLETELSAPISRIGGTFSFDSQGGTLTTTGAAAAFVTWNDGGIAANGFGRRTRCHVTMAPTGAQFYTRPTVNGALTAIWSKSFTTPLLTDGTVYSVDVYLRDGQAILLLPTGETAVITDASIQGTDTFACFEPFYNTPATDCRVYIHRAWSDTAPEAPEGAARAALTALQATAQTPKRTAAVATLATSKALTTTQADVDAGLTVTFTATSAVALLDVEIPVTMTASDSIWLRVRYSNGTFSGEVRSTWSQVNGPLRKRLRVAGLAPGSTYTATLQARTDTAATTTVNQLREAFLVAEPLAA